MKHRELLEKLFSAAVDAADPLVGIRAHLPKQPAGGRTVVVGAGKGAAQMAAALETVWQGPLEGLVVTRYGYACQTRSIEVVEASHPVPDAAGLAASQRLLELVSVLSPDDLVIALISGGGSALLPAPPAGFALDDEIALNQILLASGAPISAMNVLRKHFSTIKGGRLALATRARVASLIVSDIPGDNPAFVASGPTVPDPTTRYDALAIVDNYRLPLTPKMLAHLASPAADAPVPEDPAFARNTHRVIASASVSLEAAAKVARDHGFEAHILSDSVEGESRDVGFVHAAIAREIVSRGRPFQTPAVLLSGGETTVTLRGKGGRGGRNSEFALAFATASAGLPVTALAADTDGIDGVGDHAGAFVDGETIRRLTAKGFDGRRLLMENDSYSGFEAIGDLFITGPTGTNVNDFRAIVIE
ncbi:hydroxypyruvate reductase [Peteryoungia aggregata LMG 23059]|uniref:Hydroxypyruvate reductase n=1 Tax=Peteryoungia aggregata LMG 23059 TaxID=1368425 RepID=A0ABU0G689_9HYPH|nr:glycerate kinase [Peteryoungia aggregata]MDQ0420837.1 hydroxypyruvate reductase [Peteryoungia aggregata LMG 23059]